MTTIIFFYNHIFCSFVQVKKLFSIGLLLFYTILVCGCAFQLHYCGQKLASVNLSVFASDDGCSCNKKMAGGCCKNRFVEAKIKSEHKTPIGINGQQYNPVLLIITYFLSIDFKLSTTVYSAVVNYHSPPKKSGNGLLLKNCILRV